MVIFSMIGACGCMWNHTENNGKTNITDNMVQYMNDKYTDDSFTYDRPFGGGAGADTKTIIVSSKNYPNTDIFVQHSFDNGDIYTDNYLGVKYAEQTKLVIKGILDNVTLYEYLIFYDINRYACPNPTGLFTFEEYAASDSSCISFTVVLNGVVSDKDSFEKELEDAITAAGICCSATVYFDDNSGAYDSLETEGLSGYTFKNLYSDVFSFEMCNNKEFSASRWGD